MYNLLKNHKDSDVLIKLIESINCARIKQNKIFYFS